MWTKVLLYCCIVSGKWGKKGLVELKGYLLPCILSVWGSIFCGSMNGIFCGGVIVYSSCGE